MDDLSDRTEDISNVGRIGPLLYWKELQGNPKHPGWSVVQHNREKWALNTQKGVEEECTSFILNAFGLYF